MEDARAWAMENEVSDGTGADDAVTREQLVTMLWRYVGQHEGTGDLSGFADADTVSGWAEEAMEERRRNHRLEPPHALYLRYQGKYPGEVQPDRTASPTAQYDGPCSPQRG